VVDLHIRRILDFLINAKVDGPEVKGGTKEFLLEWKRKVALLSSLNDGKTLADTRLLVPLLANAVQNVAALQQVHVTEQQLRATDPSRKLDIAKYMTLLESAATQVDSVTQPTRGSRGFCSHHRTDISYHDDDDESPHDNGYDDDQYNASDEQLYIDVHAIR